MMYSIYIGHYESAAISKEDVAKLNKLGLKGFVFSRGDYYALKVYSSPNLENIKQMKTLLEQKGFEIEIETIDLKKSLHIQK